MEKSIAHIIDSFSELKVLIIGDVMVDSYLYGSVDRISPEAPVPVVNIDSEENRLGGAANVALNIYNLGANAMLCSVIGNDQDGDTFIQLLSDYKIPTDNILRSESRITTCKSRLISRNHQIVRFDKETENKLVGKENEDFLNAITLVIQDNNFDVAIFQDYDKGLLNENNIPQIIELCKAKNIPVAVDPKRKNFKAYKGVALFKPNLREIKEGLNIDVDPESIESLGNAGHKIQEELQNEVSMITLAEKGIFIHDGSSGMVYPAQVRNVADVSGAGDTVISIAALCLAAKTDRYLMAQLANIAGGLACEEVGVTPVSKEKLLKELHLIA